MRFIIRSNKIVPAVVTQHRVGVGVGPLKVTLSEEAEGAFIKTAWRCRCVTKPPGISACGATCGSYRPQCPTCPTWDYVRHFRTSNSRLQHQAVDILTGSTESLPYFVSWPALKYIRKNCLRFVVFPLGVSLYGLTHKFLGWLGSRFILAIAPSACKPDVSKRAHRGGVSIRYDAAFNATCLVWMYDALFRMRRDLCTCCSHCSLSLGV